jgi:two-component system NtrC family sensor kinase
MTRAPNRRVLIVDDNPAIHADFQKILGASERSGLDDLESELFGEQLSVTGGFDLAFAHQGREALGLVIAARAAEAPFALAFVDMRMPPGWDGLETIQRLRAIDPELQVVVCSAYSDHTWTDLQTSIGERDAWLVLKKPFEIIEIVQLAHALTAKWDLARDARLHVEQLEQRVRERTVELEATAYQLANEIRHRDKIEAELRLAQKLESVGQLAAGIAHEINTPLQYVGDNLEFVRCCFTSLVEACSTNVPDIAQEVPEAMDLMAHGIRQMATIVGALKEFAHPGPREATASDLNQLLRNALIVGASSYRHVATVETELAAIPLVSCFPGELNQVFLNLIINAAQAMEGSAVGRLTVKTRTDGTDVVVSIGDTGCGIPDAVRDRVFDAFFTTKAVGRGTGQGLAISRTIVVDRHGGSLTFDSKIGEGTMFHIRIPIERPDATQLAS